MASEPAEPTTRQALVEKAAQSLHDVRHASFRCTGEPTDQDLDQARALADLGLLADPAQTTELEELRAGSAKLLAVTEEFQQQRDLLLWLHAEAAWRVIGFDALTAALARHLKEAQAERDALSLLLRGMARKLVTARAELKQEKRDSAWVLNRIRRSLGTPDGRAVSVHAREVAAERDERQTRIDRVETLCREWEANPAADWTAGDAAEAARAALAGDQPTAEEPKRLHITIPDADAAGDLP